MSGKRQPLKKIVETEKVPFVSDHPSFRMLEELGGQGFKLVDVLECGHHRAARLLMSPSKTPYRHQEDGTVWRKCKECPREESA